MTKFEEEIFFQIDKHEFTEDMAKAAAEVAKKWIENAFDAGAEATINLLPEKSIPTNIKGYVEAKHQWFKENGITTEAKPDKWDKLNKQFDELLDSMTDEDWEAWHNLVLYKRKLKENGITE